MVSMIEEFLCNLLMQYSLFYSLNKMQSSTEWGISSSNNFYEITSTFFQFGT